MKHYLSIGSRYSRLSNPVEFRTTSVWKDYFQQECRCPGYFHSEYRCIFMKRNLQVNPRPIEPTVVGKELGFKGVLDEPVISLFREDAREFFAPYLPTAVWGRVWCEENGERVATNYSTCVLPRFDCVEMDRGTTPIAPRYCGLCNNAHCWAPACRHEGIIRHHIKDRPVIHDHGCSMCVHPEFYEDMKLKQRFPDIKIMHKVKIYDQDPHGWVLPGDPEWDGVFRKPPGWVDPPDLLEEAERRLREEADED